MDEYFKYVRTTLRKCFEKIKEMDERSIRERVAINPYGDQTFMVDKVAEEMILEATRIFFKDATLVSEESGVVEIGSGGPPLIIVDPVDGSVNASRGYPCYSCSIGVAEGEDLSDTVCSGVINLLTGDLYYAEKNRGAFLNGHRLRVSNVGRIEEALISVDLNIRGRLPGYVSRMSSIIEKARHVRSLGSDAIELCLVASGAADAFVDLRGFLRSLDFAAAFLIVKEAGGVVLNAEAEDLNVKLLPVSKSPVVAACSRSLGEEIIRSFRNPS
ncbi:MAG: fructose 1,6-bisphosphatase [Thaumarchaeota archaeon]|jgi:myo-inositol-1(or 4)-monophosphatase|nr:fructose 1,6-bisphosphatase [Nitrososphaerota archaeon]